MAPSPTTERSERAMTATDRDQHPSTRSSASRRGVVGVLERRTAVAGGIGGIGAAVTFIVGIAFFATSLSDYTAGDRTPAESVAFLVGHQGTLSVWYLVIFVVFGMAIIPLARALHARLRPGSPLLADAAAVFACIWAGLMFATGMVANVGVGAVADLAEHDPDHAAALWSSIDAVTEGLGGGNELVGGMWLLLVSLAGWTTRRLPAALNAVGLASAAAGVVTLVPGLSDVGMLFGLGSIVWFAWVGTVLLRGGEGAPDAVR